MSKAGLKTFISKGSSMAGYVGAVHEFHDAEYVRGWAERFAPTAPRLELFDLVLEQIARLDPPARHVVELGIGPGYMARHILERNGEISYEGVDFSAAMFDIARQTISGLMARVTLTTANLLDNSWPSKLRGRPDAIISTWALHDLGGQQPIADVYRHCHETLAPGGVLVNGDFIKPDGTAFDYEAGRFSVGRHIELLTEAGFADPRCLAELERNLENPTAGENYACIAAIR